MLTRPQSIASSPYLPTQSEYDADVITGYYDGVANQTGCAEAANKFDCLVGVNASALNTAANKINQDTALYTRGFAPIVDGEIIEEIPSQQLLKKRVNGKRTLVGVRRDIFCPFPLPPQPRLCRLSAVCSVG